MDKDNGQEMMDAIYNRLSEQYVATHGEVSVAADMLLQKAAYLEWLHHKAAQHLNDKGLRERYQVSTYQTGERENKSLGQMIKLQAQQARLLKELHLLPTKRAAPVDEGDDDEQDISDY